MSIETDVQTILTGVLQLGARGAALNRDTRLLGALPELDSMAVVSVVTALEQHFGIVFDDDEISADTFSTLGTLVELVQAKSP